jgi:protein-tyrosine phosphatase
MSLEDIWNVFLLPLKMIHLSREDKMAKNKSKAKVNGKKYDMCGLNPQSDMVNTQALLEVAQHANYPKGGSSLPLTTYDRDDYNGYLTNYHGGSSWTSHRKSCSHDGDKPMFEAEGKKLYGSSGHKLDEYSGKWDLIIDLASNVRTPVPTVKAISHKKFDVLKQFCYQFIPVKSENLSLDWSDQQAPQVTLDFWLKLWEMLPEKTVIACVGGHGRTGTCMASLMIASGLDYYSAVQTVRADYCTSAIESTSQEIYLHGLYIGMLEDSLKAETDPKEKLDIEEDLLYAKAHKPNHKNSYGLEPKEVTAILEADKPKVVYPNEPGFTKPVVTVIEEEEGWEDYKEEGGKSYYRVCVNPKCRDSNCLVQSHQGWVEWAKLDDLHGGGF